MRRMALVCQRTIRRTWGFVSPSDLSTASSRRRSRASVTTVRINDNVTANARKIANGGGPRAHAIARVRELPPRQGRTWHQWYASGRRGSYG